MSAENPAEPKRELTDNEAERLAYEAMRRDGKFAPQAPDEVAKAEAETNEAATALPPALQNPQAVLTGSATSPNAPQAPTPAPALSEPSTARTPSTGAPDEARRARFRKRIA